MSARPVRFIHAGDFHLERPLAGVSDQPDALRELLIDAPYRAAERVFDAVLAEQADFLVLSGDILDAELTGPRGPVFLLEQFTRLAECDIPVYWAGGEVDPPERWSACWSAFGGRLPENVHRPTATGVQSFVIEGDDRPLARVVGMNRQQHGRVVPAEVGSTEPAEVHSARTSELTVAVVHGEIEPSELEGHPIDYWALGGRHERATLAAAQTTAHYPGTPQGRTADEAGSHGCTLVEWAPGPPAAVCRLKPIDTDFVRWHDERMEIDAATAGDELEQSLHDRVARLRSEADGRALLLRWNIAGSGPLMRALRRGELARELVDRQRAEYASASPPVWTISLTAEPPESFPSAWYEEDTILGEFLRTVRAHEADDAPLDLSGYLSPEDAAGELAAAATVGDPAQRRRIRREAAALGVELLRAEELR